MEELNTTSAPLPTSARERLRHVATVALSLARRYGPLTVAGAVGWVCGYGLLGTELKLSALPAPWGKLPAAWLLPFQKGALALVTEAVQSLALPRGNRLQWATRGGGAAWGATLLWQWRQLEHGEGILLYGALMAFLQFAPTPLHQQTRGLRRLAWRLPWLMARTLTWGLALLLTARVGQSLSPLAGWALGGATSGLLLALFLQLSTAPRVSVRPTP